MGRTALLVPVALLALALPADATDPVPPPGVIEAGERDFIEKHWRHPAPGPGTRALPSHRALPPAGSVRRVPPGTVQRLAGLALGETGLRLRVTVTVLPDEFYTRFFEAMLAAGARTGEAQIAEALEATRRSAYTLYEKELPLS